MAGNSTNLKKILLRRGTTSATSVFIGKDREVTVDTNLQTLVVHDGSTAGGHYQALISDLPTKMSDITDDINIWKSGSLTKVSQLTDDVGYWSQSTLTKLSQLTNDSGYQTGYCSYCSYCSYCQKCSKCNETQCNTTDCSYCNCNCDCGDDTGD